MRRVLAEDVKAEKTKASLVLPLRATETHLPRRDPATTQAEMGSTGMIFISASNERIRKAASAVMVNLAGLAVAPEEGHSVVSMSARRVEMMPLISPNSHTYTF